MLIIETKWSQEIWFAHHMSGMLVEDIQNFHQKYSTHLQFLEAIYGSDFITLKNHEPLHAELHASNITTCRNAWAFGPERDNCDLKQVHILSLLRSNPLFLDEEQ
jgi:hypothetical protein